MISTKIQLKTDTIANWTLNEDALLLNGEAAVVQFPDGTSRLKIGDGTTVFKDLPYVDDNLQIQLSEDSGQTYSKLDELLLINITADEYHELVRSGNTLSNAIYEVEYEDTDCYGERLINVAEPELSSDAATKNYVDNQLLNAGDKYVLKTAMLEECSDGLSCKVDNYAITTISIVDPTTSISVVLPEMTEDNKVRDFVIRFENTGNENASIAFVPQNDEDIDYESDSDDWAIVEPGINLISFTETKR